MSTTNRSFQLRVNPLTGESEWLIIEDDKPDPTNLLEPSRSILATTSYLDMLNDSCRNRAFRLAIEKTITEPCHVLDIGAGTGLLSMMAARAMRGKGDGGKVSACESYLPMGKLMWRVLRENGMDNMVKVFHRRSDELRVGVELDARADVLVSEILDSELLGEGLIPTLQHAHGMLLVENPKTVPYKAITYGQLSEPFKIFEFDFWKRPDSYRETGMHIKTIGDGRIHALLSWWVLQLDQEGSVYYSTAPEWISSSYGKNSSSSRCVPGLSSGAAPEKIAAYGDKNCRSALSKATKNALQRAGSTPCCVVADDSVFLTVLAASSSIHSTVISFLPGFQNKGAKYLQAVADANSFSMDQVQVVGKRASCLLTADTNRRKVDLLMGEPFYCGNEGMLPWQNLRFWKERTILDPILCKDAVIMPCRGILRACAMSLPDLWRSRCCLKKIEGFDHSVVNENLGACGELPSSCESPCLPYFIWQCGEVKELSEVFSIMDFDFSKHIQACNGKTKISFSNMGLCHGFALWIDWVMDERESIVLSTGPVSRYWKQGVKLLSKPVAVNGTESTAEIEALFDPTTGEVTINLSFASS